MSDGNESTGPRRVITGMRGGKAVVLADERLRPHQSGPSAISLVWRSETVPELPNDGHIPDVLGFTPPGGAWMNVWTLPAHSAPGSDSKVVPVAEDGFHATDSVDISLVLDGEMTMAIDDGVEVVLKKGDCVVLNGTRHAWFNRGGVPVTMMTLMIGAHRAD